MQKILPALFIVTCICLSNSIDGMKRRKSSKNILQTNLIQIPLPNDIIPFLAGYSTPKMKNVLMKVCTTFNTLLKDKTLIIRTNPHTVSLKDKIKNMFECACSGNTDMIDFLLNVAHMRPDHKNSLGMTPLHYAMEKNNKNIVLLLLQHHADVSIPKPQIYPLHDAAYKGDTEYVMSLLASNVDLNPTLEDGNTPLSIAILEGHTEIEKLLRDAGAKEKRKQTFDEIILGPIDANRFRAVIQRNQKYPI